MNFTNNYSITKLFMSKDITVYANGKPFIVRAHSVKEFYENTTLNSVYHLWVSSLSQTQKLYFTKIENSYDALVTMIFEYGKFDRYRDVANKMREVLPLVLPQVEIDMPNKIIRINGITMTAEI